MWLPEGHRISYQINTVRRRPRAATNETAADDGAGDAADEDDGRPAKRSKEFYYTVTFHYTFVHDQDCVFFAYSVPHTYSMLRSTIASLTSNPATSAHVRR